ESASRAVCERLVGLPEWTRARTVLLFHAMADEVDLTGAIEASLASGKHLFLPRVCDRDVIFHRIADRAALSRLMPHGYGMLEPLAAEPRWEAGVDQTLLACPGRAFDREGNRLGRGGGFYDRFLNDLAAVGALGSVSIVGVGYEVQFVESLPSTPHDHPVDLLVTEQRAIRFDSD
ncbi:MAG: 5-formyltetrahydrofolate cyclo-ligase, partial [Spirochaetota bacterium]